MTARGRRAARKHRPRAPDKALAPSNESPARAEYKVRAKVWLYPGAGGWHFVNLTARQSHEIRVRFADGRRGWGAVPIAVQIGRTAWRTSLFPDKKSATYLFAIKAAVRQQEAIAAGDTVRAIVQIR